MEQVKAIEYNELPIDAPDEEEDPADARIAAILGDINSF